MSLVMDLHSAAKTHFKERKKSFALTLAAEILLVDCGLKPCYLYDLNGAGVLQIEGYLMELHRMGFIHGPLHVLNMADTILIIKVSSSVSYLSLLLNSKDLHVIDVSAQLKEPEMFSQNRLSHIRSHLSDLLEHLKRYQDMEPGTVSVAEICSPEWNLCTMFGFLLQFPAVYWFDTTTSCENCLSLTPLRRFKVQSACPKVGLQSMQVYSFTIPESICDSVKTLLNTWSQGLGQTFQKQQHFTDLRFVAETVTLPAMAL
ncbi:UPF0739 protein C1orf74 homolog [Gastrophryne carolinensis]